jgi:hypothetical protein
MRRRRSDEEGRSMREEDVCVCTMGYRVVDVAKVLILGAFFFLLRLTTNRCQNNKL